MGREPGRTSRRELRRQVQMLDAALDLVLDGARVDGDPHDLGGQLAAARLLRDEVAAEEPPAAALVSLRAALAVQEAGRLGPRRFGLVHAFPSAVAAVVAGLIVFAAIAGSPQPVLAPAATPVNVQREARTLRLASLQMALVQSKAAAGDLTGASSAAQDVRDVLLETEQATAGLVVGDPARAELLTTLGSEISQLNALLAALHLGVPPLASDAALTRDGNAAGAAPASSSTASCHAGSQRGAVSPASTTSTTSSTSTTQATSTTQGQPTGLGPATSVYPAGGSTSTTRAGQPTSTSGPSASSTTTTARTGPAAAGAASRSC